MACESKNLLRTEEQLEDIRWWREVEPDWKKMVRDNFEHADNIIAIFEKEGDNVSLSSFGIHTGAPNSNPRKMVNQFFSQDQTVTINYNGDKGAIDRMFNGFRRKMVELSIFDFAEDTPVDLSWETTNPAFNDYLNEGIYNYKTDLINAIWKLVDTSRKTVFESPEQFANEQAEALTDFENYTGSKSSQLYLDARDAFSILKNFDILLKNEAPFIGVKEMYANRYEAGDKYTYEGANTDLFSTWTTKEEVDINGQMGKMLSTIIEQFPQYTEDGRHPMPDLTISKTEFHQVMTRFKEWLMKEALPKSVGINTVFGADKTFNTKKAQFLRLNINNEADAIEADKIAGELFDKFVENVFGKSEIKNSPSRGLVKGIQQMMHSGLHEDIKRAIWALVAKTEKNLAVSTSMSLGTLSDKLIQDGYKSGALHHITDNIKNAVEKFRFTAPSEYLRIKNKYGIEIDKDDPNTVRITKNSKGYKLGKPIIFTFNDGQISLDTKLGSTIPNSEAKIFIEELLNTHIPDNYGDVLAQMHTGIDLLNLFAYPVALTLLASDPAAESNSIYNNSDAWKNLNTSGSIDDKKSELKLTRYYNQLGHVSTFFGLAWRTNLASTLKNSFGNNVAAYTLTSEIYQVDKLVQRMKMIDPAHNTFVGNPVFDQMGTAVGKAIVRLDADINGQKKAASQLTTTELYTIGILSDFYNRLKNDNESDLYFQNSCFSDKNTHFLIPYNKEKFRLNSSTNLKTALDDIIKNNNSKGIKVFEDAIFDSRKTAYTKILNNLVEDYIKAINNDVSPELLEEFQDAQMALAASYDLAPEKSKSLEAKVKAIEAKIKQEREIKYGAILKNLTSDKPTQLAQLKELATNSEKWKKLFFNAGLDYTDELHSSNGMFNETLEAHINMYVLSKDNSAFKDRLKKQQEYFLGDLQDAGFRVDRSFDKQTYEQIRKDIGDSWFNSKTQQMLLSKTDKDGNVILNPVLQAYFYSDILLSNSFNEIIFGRTFFHPNKSGAKPNDADYLTRSEASRLSASYKRTVIAGGTTHSFYPAKYGISSNIRFAVVKDLGASVFNMMGVTDKVDSMDGSGLSSPYQAYMENMSLYDAKVGMDKKTIFGDNDSRYGTPTLLKWAVFAITNDRRRMSMGSNISAEKLFKKMHSDKIDKIIDLATYYKPGISENHAKRDLIDDSRILSEHDYIYRFDPNTGIYYRLDSIKMEGNTAIISETAVTSDGRVNKDVIAKPRKIVVDTLYDLDQVFGGAYAMQMDPESKSLGYSDVNIKLGCNIICNENLKDKFTGYLVNKSGIKVGARNINSEDIFFNDEPLMTTKMSLMFGGVQMNADHEIEGETEVTEMSQMISSLIQNGYFTDDVMDIYNEIGEVVVDSLKEINGLVLEGNFEALHTKLGKDLIDDFSSGKDTMGLAQSYLLKAAKILNENPDANVKIPFSDPTLLGAFTANIISNINKKGIRRKYAGIASVLVPSRGMIQYYNFGGYQMMYDKLAQKIGQDKQYAFTALDYITKGVVNNPKTGHADLNGCTYDKENKQFILSGYSAKTDGNIEKEIHPFINLLNDRHQADMGDTVIIAYPDGHFELKVLDNYDDYDNVRNSGKYAGCDIFKWSIKPVDLRQSDTTFNLPGYGRQFSIYDLASVRANHYLRQCYNKKTKTLSLSNLDTLDKLDVINFVLSQYKDFVPLTIDTKLDANTVKLWQKYLTRQTKADLKSLDKKGRLRANAIYEYRLDFELDSNLESEFNELLYNDNAENIILSNKLEFEVTDDLHKDFNQIRTSEHGKDIAKQLWQNKYSNIPVADFLNMYNTYLETIPTIVMFDKYRKSVKVSNVNTRFAEVIMGRVNGAQLGLRENDSVSDILERGEDFFKSRIMESESLTDDNVDKNTYDLVVKGTHGENLYVMLRSLHSIKDPNTGEIILSEDINGWSKDNTTFKELDENIYYKDKPLCVKGFKEFYSRPGLFNQNHLLVIDDLSELKEILDSDSFNRIEYNYTLNNAESLIKHQYNRNFNDAGELTKDLELHNWDFIEGITESAQHYDEDTMMYRGIAAKKGTKLSDIITPELIKALNGDQEYKRDKDITRIARERYASFIKQLEYVGARIPTQSMQSFMGLKLVDFTNSKVNEVYVPAVQTWLEGSDYDIDKLYIMGMELNGKGRIPTNSKLQNDLEADLSDAQLDEILNLAPATGITYQMGIDDENGLSIEEVREAIALRDVSALNKIAKTKQETVSFQFDVDEESRRKFIDLLNKHNSTRLSKFIKESALKNSIVHRITKLLKHPMNQVLGHAPISMDSFRDIASRSTLGKKEQIITTDNPTTKFIMQTQNMVGKEVIGITAVALKVFFATSTFMNSRVNDMLKALQNEDYVEVQNALNDITFTDPIDGNISTIANLNLDIINDFLDNLTPEQKFALNNNVPGFTTTIEELAEKADIIDAAEVISQLLSCATDNAKELILAKINATTDFADAWSLLVATCHELDNEEDGGIAGLMMSSAFELVQKYTKTNLFTDVVKGNNKKSAIEFVLGKSQLPGINIRDLKYIVGAYRTSEKDNTCFINKLLYETETEGENRGKLILDSNGNPIPRHNPIVNENWLINGEGTEDSLGVFDSAVNSDGDRITGEIRTKLFDLFSDPTQSEISLEIAKILMDHIAYLVEQKKLMEQVTDDEEEDDHIEEEEQNYDSNEDSYQEENEEEDDGRSWRSAPDFDENSKVLEIATLKSLKNLEAYFREYVVPKNEAFVNARKNGDDLDGALEKLTQFYTNVLPAVEEQTILGAMLGVNQGIKTNLNDFYAKLRRVETFINQKIKDRKVEVDEPFDIINFLKSDSYKEKWIDKYEGIKSVFNILKIIDSVPNFKNMYQQNALAFELVQHSFRNKLNMKLSKSILDFIKDGSSIRKKLTSDQWDIMDKYVRDLILTNWVFGQNIQIQLPTNQEYYAYDANTDQYELFPNERVSENGGEITDPEKRRINLSTFAGCASFVRYFENTLIPELSRRYGMDHAFFRNLTSGFQFSRTHNQKIHHTKLAVNAMLADSNSSLGATYSNILQDFNNIATDPVTEFTIIKDGQETNPTLQDVLFLYNTLVYKNAFTESGFTRLFESVVFNDDNSLINNYQEYLANLDSNIEDTGSVDQDKLIIDKDGTFEWGILKGNINDLLARLAFDEKSAKSFNIKLERNEEGAVTSLEFRDMFDNPIKLDDGSEKEGLNIAVPNANDWTLGMPRMGASFDETGGAVNGTLNENYNIQESNRYRFNSRTVIQEVTYQIAKRFGLNVGTNPKEDHIVYINDETIPSWTDYELDPDSSIIQFRNREDWEKVSRAKGFVHNGKVFLNTDRMGIDTAMHEILHVVSACMKFSTNPELRQKYYNALDSITEFYKTKNRPAYTSILRAYNGSSRNSDFKEELFIHYLTNKFSDNFRKRFGNQRFTDDIEGEISDILNDIFETNLPEDINLSKLANTRVNDFMLVFKSKLFDEDANTMMNKALLSEKIKTIKRVLIDNSFKEDKGSKIIYDC